MADPFKKVQAGQSLDVSAQAWNAFLDNVRANKFKAHNQVVDPLVEYRQADIIKIRNDSGRDCDRFSVLGLGSPIISPVDNLREFKNQVAVSVIEPKHPQHFGKFVVLLEPLKIGKIGRAWVSGVCPAYINVEDKCHEFADVADGEISALTSRPVGSARIVWREKQNESEGTGLQWAIVRLSNVPDDFRRFKLTESLAKCGKAPAKRVLFGETQSGDPKWCETDCPFEVHDSLGIVGSFPASKDTVGWAKWMADSSRWEVVQLGEGCCSSSSSSGSSSSSSGSSSSSSGSSSSSSSESSSSESSSSSSFPSESSSSESSSSSSESSESSSSESSSSKSSDSSSSESSSSDSSSSSLSSSSSSNGSSGSASSGSSSKSASSSSSGSRGSSSYSSNSQGSSSGFSSSEDSSSGVPSASEVSIGSNSASVPSSSNDSSSGLSSSDPGGISGTIEVLIRCPVRDGDTVTFPAQRMNFVNGRLQSIEPASPCSFNLS